MTPSRPYVDRPVPDRAAAGAVAARCAAGWDLPEPHELRHGMNSLYACGDVVLRVGVSTAPAAAAHRLVRWLLDAGVPTVEPIDGLSADTDGHAVTGWRAVPATSSVVDWEAVGRAVRRVHELRVDDVPDGYPVPDPSAFPWWRFDDMVADVAGEVDGPALEALCAAVDRHRGWPERLRCAAVLCHGDVHPGNVLPSPAGTLLIDWDLLCVADPAWDHAMLTTHAARWGGDPAVYERFRRGYGEPAVDAGLAAALGELRNVAATLMRVKAGRTDPAAAAEAEHRLRFWRGESDAPWHAQ